MYMYGRQQQSIIKQYASSAIKHKLGSNHNICQIAVVSVKCGTPWSGRD